MNSAVFDSRTRLGKAASGSGLLRRRCACGKHTAGGECEECRAARAQGRLAAGRSGGEPVAAMAGAGPAFRSGREFSRIPARPAGGPMRGELAGGEAEPAQLPADQPVGPAVGEPQPVPLQNPPKGPPITVTNGWANPAGKSDRTTVGIGELNSFVVSDVEGGKWSSADGKGTTVNSVSFRWTASAAGTNTITYTAADKSQSSVTMTTVVPSRLSGKKDKDLTYSAGSQGAGMELTITVHPTTVSFQALELMEGVCSPSKVSGYFSTHTPPSHDAAAGAGSWEQVGTANDVSDTADSSGWPAPWSKGGYTWAIPASWRLKGASTSTAFSATSDQVVSIAGSDGTTTVTKLGAKASRKP